MEQTGMQGNKGQGCRELESNKRGVNKTKLKAHKEYTRKERKGREESRIHGWGD